MASLPKNTLIRLQCALKLERGIANENLVPDGDEGEETIRTLVSYQAKHGLSETGKFDDDVIFKLIRARYSFSPGDSEWDFLRKDEPAE